MRLMKMNMKFPNIYYKIMAKKSQYIVYIGDDIQDCFTDLDTAKGIYNKLPSGKGKRPGLRRQLVKETTIMQDSR